MRNLRHGERNRDEFFRDRAVDGVEEAHAAIFTSGGDIFSVGAEGERVDAAGEFRLGDEFHLGGGEALVIEIHGEPKRGAGIGEPPHALRLRSVLAT